MSGCLCNQCTCTRKMQFRVFCLPWPCSVTQPPLPARLGAGRRVKCPEHSQVSVSHRSSSRTGFAGAPELSLASPTCSFFDPSSDGEHTPLGEVLISFYCCLHKSFPFFLLSGGFWKQLVGTLTLCLFYILFPDVCSLPI